MAGPFKGAIGPVGEGPGLHGEGLAGGGFEGEGGGFLDRALGPRVPQLTPMLALGVDSSHLTGTGSAARAAWAATRARAARQARERERRRFMQKTSKGDSHKTLRRGRILLPANRGARPATRDDALAANLSIHLPILPDVL